MKQDGAIARSIAEQGAVLLKNDQLLPLDAKSLHSIALIGPYAGAAHTGGGGSSHVLRVPAVLEAWYPGGEDRNAVADLLFGTANPSGKLPVTFPKAEGDTPAHTPEQYPGVNGTAVYSEGLKVGYRWYEAANITPLFPFGYGLSYTTFELRNLQAPAEIDSGLQITVSVDVANTGSRAGAEVVQVYVAHPASAGEPPRQLRGFAKVELQPHQSKHVTIAVDPRAFSIWDTRKNQWAVIPGAYELLVGDSSRDLPLHSKIAVRSASPGQ